MLGLVLFLLSFALVLILLTFLVVSLLLTVERSGVAVLLGHWLAHVRSRHVEELILVVEGHRLGAQVLVGVEATESHDVGQTRDLDHRHGLLVGVEVLVVSVVLSGLLLLEVLELFWHGRQGHALGQVGEGVDESASLFFSVIEGAAIAKLALAGLLPLLAGHGLVVGVYGSQCGFSEVGWQRLYKFTLRF